MTILDNVTLNVAGFAEESIVDGPGIRFTIFVQGCPRHCIGCHNPETIPFIKKDIYTLSEIKNKIVENPLVKGITLSGGEPFEQAWNLIPLVQDLRQNGYSVISYTGYTIEELELKNDMYIEELLCSLDFIIDGPFKQEFKSLEIPFRGSTNQRIIRCCDCKFPNLFPDKLINKDLRESYGTK